MYDKRQNDILINTKREFILIFPHFFKFRVRAYTYNFNEIRSMESFTVKFVVYYLTFIPVIVHNLYVYRYICRFECNRLIEIPYKYCH